MYEYSPKILIEPKVIVTNLYIYATSDSYYFNASIFQFTGKFHNKLCYLTVKIKSSVSLKL